MKKVCVATVDMRSFVQDILDLGSKGAKIDDSCVAVKGMFLRAEVLVPKTAIIDVNERITVSADSVAEAVIEHQTETVEVEIVQDRVYSAEELESMTIKQVKEVTGLSGRDKAKMIAEYVESLTQEVVENTTEQ